MKLPRNGREYAKWDVEGVPVGGTLEARFNGAGSWHTLELVDGTTHRLLVAGPDADPGTAVVLSADRNDVEIRLTDFPEIVVRNGGDIRLDPPAPAA